MIEDIHVNIAELIDLRRTGDNITVRQKKQFDYDISCLKQVDGRLVNGEFKRLKDEQLHFVRNLLGHCILTKVPKLEKILAVFELSMDDIFCEDERFQCEYD